MVLVAFVLVLAAAASFAAGIAMSRTSDMLVYISIAFSLAAFLILALASLRARQAAREGADVDWATTRLRSLDTESATGPLLEGLDPTQLDMAPSWKREARQAWRAAEPALDEELEEQLEAEEEEADFEVPVAPVTTDAASFEDRGWGIPDEEEEAHLADEVEFAEEDVLDVHAEVQPVVDAGALDPIDDYDDLTAAEILPQLHDLDLDGLRWVRQRERSGAKRATVLNQVEEVIVERGGAKPAARKTSAARKKSAKTAKTAKKTAPARRASKTSRGR